ncbi:MULTISPECIES: winged helix-turn-helix domain-containing protein [Haloferax]|uniref:Transcriptional regulator n=1 Tax=Haloferax marinum TaxID=2666143 RepID=A0A6A8GE48_9EURY|nr:MULTISPECIES: winged helix-turn-helix domain-containing protein [Haloferax]KAB1191178.1 helix-turn-helix transcriptional regulator [Haloferax sp. CBA1150]MRW98066.1 transcriptional regulator [Haloferax marinum]
MTSLSKDELFRILSNSRRRQILYFLHRADEPITLKELAAMVASRENETTIEEVTDEERQRVYISLYQTHLPKLESAGLVRYDEEERNVSLVSDVANQGFFWMQTEPQRSWTRYYGSLGVLGWVLIFGLWAQLPIFSLLSWAGVAIFVSTGLLVLVLAQYSLEGQNGAPPDAFEALVE